MNPEIQKSLEDPEFSRILQESESFYDEAQNFFRWSPPNGQYIVLVSAFSHGTTELKKLKKKSVWARVGGTILHGELEGKEFELTYASIQNFNGLKTLASVLAGEPVGKLPECLDVIANSVGNACLRVNVSRTPRKEGGDPFVNIMPTERLEMSEAATEQTAPEVPS